MAWVYILISQKGQYYIGSTASLKKRLVHHKSGHTPSTKRMGEVALVFKQEYQELETARKAERFLKRLKRKDYIEKIIKDGRIDKDFE